jgi:pyridoxal phosphate enzyme (YggS family)
LIEENLSHVEERIRSACNRVGRSREEVTLIAVSKTKPIEMLMDAFNAGIREFGENKVQELTGKYDVLPKDIHWHLIGHLQTNKVKYIIDKTDLIHSVDSYRLAEQINKEAEKKNIVSNILIEVNIANEESKYGVRKDEVLPLIIEISKLKNIRIRGLMTVAPFTEDAEENRVHFSNLRQLNVDIKSKNIDNISMDVLSMGMTGDYEVAIEEGATMVRVGTGIFGVRNYNIE